MKNNLKRKYLKPIIGFFNLHFDLPTIIILLILIFIFYRPLLLVLFGTIDFLDDKITFPDWFTPLIMGIIANLLSAIIIVPLLFWIFRINYKSNLCGNFKAYDINEKGEEVLWGKIKLTYNLFSNRVRGRLLSPNNDADIFIEAIFERGQYLRGIYIEKKRSTRRRLGAFLLVLNGEGNTYAGQYVFVDPQDDNFLPKVSKVKWILEDD